MLISSKKDSSLGKFQSFPSQIEAFFTKSFNQDLKNKSFLAEVSDNWCWQ